MVRYLKVVLEYTHLLQLSKSWFLAQSIRVITNVIEKAPLVLDPAAFFASDHVNDEDIKASIEHNSWP